MGLFTGRGSRYAVFDTRRPAEEGGAVEELLQVPPYQSWRPEDELATHFTDLTRKECMQCHLWSQGRAVRGRVGFDGEYRGEGCAACHVAYGTDGLSRSRDRTIARFEPGHPLEHRMTRAPTTEACTSCHQGDASIGLHFRGLSQLPPGAAGGPDVPGTTDAPLWRAFHVDDPAVTPPDLHHAAGMHCIDCHTLGDVMGDGRLHGQMEHAVEISCEACHGTFDRASELRTERGTPLEHLEREGDDVWLVSKVDGERHRVPQVVHVLDPERPEYNARAAEAMTPEHGRLQCYTCHAGWNVNFLGFHFDRNLSLTQLDLLSGRRTPGRVTTQEKVFATWKSFYAGLDPEGRFAPYLTGFSTMGTVRDEDGEVVLDQVMPVTEQGLSGLTMIHHQLHSTRPTARSCVECHRSSATWGAGSPNFRLARRLALVADRRGVEVVAVDRGQLGASVPLAKLVLPDVVALELDCDPLQGAARFAWAAEGGRGVHALDLTDPARPRRAAFRATVNPQALALVGEHLLLADGAAGLKVFDVSDRGRMELVASAPSFDARDVAVQWPHAFVADGAGGLAIFDVRVPIAPRYVGGIATGPGDAAESEALHVRTLFQYSRPTAVDGAPADVRRPARPVAAVLDARTGLLLVDVTHPDRPAVLWPPAEQRARSRAPVVYRGLELASHVDLAEPAGGAPTSERDHAYVLAEERGGRESAVVVVDVTDPLAPREVGRTELAGETEMLVRADWYSAPFLERRLLVPGDAGVAAVDASVSRDPAAGEALPAIADAFVVAVEEFPLDAMVAPDGAPLKDVSHEGARWARRGELERILDVPAEALGAEGPSGLRSAPGVQARMALERADLDRSGVLEPEEARRGGALALDVDGDGRVPLSELAGRAGLAEDAAGGGRRGGLGRGEPDGDLARLLDGVDPFEHDRDGDGGLSRLEASRALFAALDLDSSGRLDLDEMSRHPGPLRDLRWGDAEARERFDDLDRNGDGLVGRTEVRMRDEEFDALDTDRDGRVGLPRGVPAWQRARGFVPTGAEWPARRGRVSGLPPVITTERLLAALDTNDDGVLSGRELRRRPGLLEELDRNRDGEVAREELDAGVAFVLQAGVRGTFDGLEERWDLDGDGRVEPDELPAAGSAWLRSRR
jgi:Ca2+-binding EF-hand superfamily protein